MPLFSHILTCVQLGTQILPKKTKNKILVIQNKCIGFCLRLDKMQSISLKHSLHKANKCNYPNEYDGHFAYKQLFG